MRWGWGGFIERAAVRKVVYVLVGLALAALLAATGVRPARGASTVLVFPGTDISLGGFHANDLSVHFDVAAGASVVVTLDADLTAVGTIDLQCGAGSTYDSGGSPSAGAHTFAPGGALTDCSVIFEPGSSGYDGALAGSGTYEVVGATSTPTPTATPTPAPTPTPTPTAAPIEVALVAVDRARVDGLTTITVYGFGLVIFLAAMAAVALGFRR